MKLYVCSSTPYGVRVRCFGIKMTLIHKADTSRYRCSSLEGISHVAGKLHFIELINEANAIICQDLITGII